ncbi:hypothetical protein D3C71_1203030 [compost metagenome]
MNTDEVKNIMAVAVICRVTLVFRVGPPVIIYPHPADRCTASKGITVLMDCRLIHISQELLQPLGHAVHLAEGSDHTGLLRRVAQLVTERFQVFHIIRMPGPLYGVTPVCIFRQQAVHRQRRTL